MGKHSLPAVQLPSVLDFISHSASQTVRIGQRLGAQMQPGDITLLMGEVGVGKTHLVKGIAQGLTSTDMVTSPSFVLVNEYRGYWSPAEDATQHEVPIYHIDLYRIDNPSELMTIGIEEIMDETGICLVEWAERAAHWMPGEHLAVSMQHLDETKRVLRMEPHGQRYHALLEAFKNTAFA